MSSLQQRMALVETDDADLRLELARAKRQGPTDAQFGVTSLGQPRQLSESPDTCCRWTPGDTCQTTERVCSMVHEYIETKELTVECGAKWKKCPETSATLMPSLCSLAQDSPSLHTPTVGVYTAQVS